MRRRDWYINRGRGFRKNVTKSFRELIPSARLPGPCKRRRK
jgi:hypothetical protein